MIPIERFYRAELLGERISDLEGDIAILETSLSDGHNEEIEAYTQAEVYLSHARKALQRAQAEARRGCEGELLSQQLTASILQFPAKVGQ